MLGVGFSHWSAVGPLAHSSAARNVIVAVVLFLMSLPLETSAMWAAVRRPASVLLAVGVNFLVTPLLGWAAATLLAGDWRIGLLVTVAQPCTLASAAVWTRRAGGNDAVALFTTVSTNIVCFAVTPAWLLATTGQGVELPAGQMATRLGLLVVIPIVLAQAARRSIWVREFAHRRKSHVHVLAQCGMLTMVLIGAYRAGDELGDVFRLFTDLAPQAAATLAAVFAVHTAAFFCGFGLARLAGRSPEDRRAVAMAGSQKTLMVGLYVATTYFDGLVIVPLIFFHITQLVVDTMLADWLRKRGTSAAR